MKWIRIHKKLWYGNSFDGNDFLKTFTHPGIPAAAFSLLFPLSISVFFIRTTRTYFRERIMRN